MRTQYVGHGNEEDRPAGSVYRIIKEQRKSGMRYIVDYRDDAGRRTMRRFKKACEAEVFKSMLRRARITGIAIARPTTVIFSTWANEWFEQKEALGKAEKKTRPSTLDGWRSDLKVLLSYFGGYKLHTITTARLYYPFRRHSRTHL